MRFCCLEYGGLDILVSNAGVASSAPLEETSVDMGFKFLYPNKRLLYSL